MKITHVIRGDDHISNTPKQIVIYEALDYNIPKFAHIPLIMGPDGSRLSKRHGATSIMEYKEQGYLPEALINFLALIGWSPGDNREILSKNDLINEFTLEKVNKTNAIFGIDKLNWINGQYIRQKDSKGLLKLLTPFLREKGIIDNDFDREKMLGLVELYKVRVRTLTDFVNHITIFYSDDITFEKEGVEKYLRKEGASNILRRWKERLLTLDSFGKDNLERSCRELADELGIKPAQLIHPTRVAISGRTGGAGLFEMMEIMGKDTVLRRLDYAISNIAL
jgi:glutamyl-tRNA synthetase